MIPRVAVLATATRPGRQTKLLGTTRPGRQTKLGVSVMMVARILGPLPILPRPVGVP